jgi:oligoendopeptidase F
VFGELLVLALYGMYREQGDAFVPGYRTLLESGGSKSPDELLGELGINTQDPQFWQRGFQELRRLVSWAGELAEGR